MQPYELPEDLKAMLRENTPEELAKRRNEWHNIANRPNVDEEDHAYALAIVAYIDSLAATPAN